MLTTKEVSISQIPQVKNYLDKNPLAVKSKTAKKVSTKNKKDETDFGEVDFSKILKTTDSLGKITYTFRMLNGLSNQNPEKPFFDNLIIELGDAEDDYKSYIVRYYYGEEPSTSQFNYKGFSGHIEQFSLSGTSFGLDFLNNNQASKSTCRISIETDCSLSGHHHSLDDYGCRSNTLYVTIYTFCDNERTTINSGGYSTQNTTVNPRTGGRGGSSSPILTPYNEVVLAMYDTLRKKLGLSSRENNWLMRQENHFFAMELFDFISLNGWGTESKEFAKWEISFKMLPKVPCGVGHDCVKSIGTMAEGLRNLHGEEGVLMADYFDSLVSNFNSFTKADLQEFYDLAKLVTERYNDYMYGSISGAFAEGTAQILSVVLFEIGGNAAVGLLQKIPVSWVLRGTTLTPFVQNIARLGIQGTQSHVRIVKTTNPVSNARGLFTALTKNAISKTTQSNGAIVANMGNGNFITFRTVSQSGFPATIDLNFPNLFTLKQVIKFSL